jgi:hypothetical protein
MLFLWSKRASPLPLQPCALTPECGERDQSSTAGAITFRDTRRAEDAASAMASAHTRAGGSPGDEDPAAVMARVRDMMLGGAQDEPARAGGSPGDEDPAVVLARVQEMMMGSTTSSPLKMSVSAPSRLWTPPIEVPSIRTEEYVYGEKVGREAQATPEPTPPGIRRRVLEALLKAKDALETDTVALLRETLPRALFVTKTYPEGSRGARRQLLRQAYLSLTPEERTDFRFRMAELRLQAEMDDHGFRSHVDLEATSPDASLCTRVAMARRAAFEEEEERCAQEARVPKKACGKRPSLDVCSSSGLPVATSPERFASGLHHVEPTQARGKRPSLDVCTCASTDESIRAPSLAFKTTQLQPSAAAPHNAEPKKGCGKRPSLDVCTCSSPESALAPALELKTATHHVETLGLPAPHRDGSTKVCGKRPSLDVCTDSSAVNGQPTSRTEDAFPYARALQAPAAHAGEEGVDVQIDEILRSYDVCYGALVSKLQAELKHLARQSGSHALALAGVGMSISAQDDVAEAQRVREFNARYAEASRLLCVCVCVCSVHACVFTHACIQREKEEGGRERQRREKREERREKRER